MKVIDLLNKIANNEEVPKKFKYRRENFVYMDGDYSSFDTNVWFSECHLFLDNLNDEIEIIEEKPKKIEKLEFCKIDDYTLSGLVASVNELNYEYVNKINEIIDYLLEKEENNPIERIEFDD